MKKIFAYIVFITLASALFAQNIRITSYNVCYTKLLRSEQSFELQNPIDVTSSDKIVVYGKYEGKNAQLSESTIYEKRESYDYRITSYNVCYTKLLRVRVVDNMRGEQISHRRVEVVAEERKPWAVGLV